VAENCPYLNELRVDGCSNVTITGLAMVAIRCFELKTVHFDDPAEILVASLERLFPLVSWEIEY
jgi:hypothetical protein